MSVCQRCEILPKRMPESGILYIVPPIAEILEDMRRYFSGAGLGVSEPYTGILAVPFSGRELHRACEEYLSRMNRLEKDDTRVLLAALGEPPSVSQLARMSPLSQLVGRLQGEWLVDVLREERLVAYFQPIVECDRPDRVHAFECLLRGRDGDGAIIPPGQLFDAARAADLLFHLDRTARLTCIRDTQGVGLDKPIFINFNPTAIYNPEFCLRTTLAAIREADIAPEQIVFEVVESDGIEDVGHLLGILEYYRRHGFKVALDDLGAGFSSLNLLSKLRPDYMKMDMELIRDVDKDDYKARITENLLSLARSLDVRCIAEGVETLGEWQWLASHGADLVQGYLFARPAAKPPVPVVPGQS